ncbi:uncharacterized protein Z520_07901 [Fonsecaea multimorphosa CBS 102226]|uniref:Mitochondrial import inner membrane translocase subunit Tim21 n=1 Tax=Fonsecaea multimorphosa CBS 102226 TaxID=1442371 RepID=A0A0D2H460_9EURO|nr:uncharacterized protein Z520_07901 [Fonsecaea multimorphosa CBS 102226]KIX96635.1 hypothetical protein Z520_07901 [Fonsecaea multimorphosa CBS 102226]OAL17492.1 hypothetical protein AYO22_11624 [Fonsecaea multimorphosa]
MASKAQARAFQRACRLRLRRANSGVTSSTAGFLEFSPRPGSLVPERVACVNLLEVVRSASCLSEHRRSLPSTHRAQSRHASTSSSSGRRAVTVTTDDGRYTWNELSAGEKAARGTQQTFNFVLVSLGLVGTITIIYLLYTDLFSPTSYTIQFNAAVSRIRASPECRALLGPASQIKAYGEPTSNKWARARPLAHSTEVDRFGTTHFRMHFNVEGTESGVMGVVTVHMTKPKDGDRLEYELLSLSVKGHETVYLENRDKERGVKAKAAKMFGVQWR